MKVTSERKDRGNMERGIEEEGKKKKLHKKGERVGKTDRS